MTLPVSDRRQFLTFGLAGLVCSASGFDAGAASHKGKVFPLPFAGSRTVSSFASGLFFVDERVPPELRHAIQVELDRIDVRPDAHADERRRAEFFAWLAVRRIAPRYLRRAGYEALVIECEKQADLRGGAPARAQQTIGIEHRDRASRWSPRISAAYGACAHASTATFYAGLDEMRWVAETGNYCARALVECLSVENPDPAEQAWVWDFAVNAINDAVAVSIRTDRSRDILRPS
jgi:hypothetical protein